MKFSRFLRHTLNLTSGISIFGALLGIIENLGIAMTSGSMRDIFAFGFLVIVLLVRPGGLSSRKGARP